MLGQNRKLVTQILLVGSFNIRNVEFPMFGILALKSNELGMDL